MPPAGHARQAEADVCCESGWYVFAGPGTGVAGPFGQYQPGPQATGARATLAHLLAPSAVRVKTRFAGLYLCGADAEPLACLSGRAARIAAALALKDPALNSEGSE